MYKVLISAPYLQQEFDEYKHLLSNYEIILPQVNERLSEEEVLKYSDIDGIICGDDKITRNVIDQISNLKVVVKWGTGIDSIDWFYLKEKNIPLFNTPNAFTIPVSESAIGLILSLSRRIIDSDRWMKKGNWYKLPGKTINESTIGIIGRGNIGSEVKRKLKMFTDNILIYDIKNEIKETDPDWVELDYLLKHSDIITIHCDLNPTSHGLISTERINKMKDGVILINTARGPIINEQDLVKGLFNSKFGGVGLDVFENEPLDEDSPLRNFDKCVLSAHATNSSPKYWKKVHINSINNLKKILK